MARKPIPQGVTLLLVAGLLTLPIAGGVVLAVSALLSAMGDAIGGAVLKYVSLGCGILWAVDLASLVLVQGLNSLGDPPDERPES